MKNLISLILILFFIGCSNLEKPNIIWITIEDQSQYLLPLNGNDDISLPNLQKIADESLIFENMYSVYPVCAPARSAIITGMYPNSIGTHNMRTMAYSYYKKNGNFGERNENEKVLGIPRYSSKLAESIKTFPSILRENGYFTYNKDKGDYNFIISDSTWSEYGTNEKITKADSPIFAVYNYNVTHESSMWQRDKEPLMVDPKDLKIIPPIFPDDSIVRHSLAVNYSNLIEMDRQVGKLVNQLKEEDLYDDSYIFFYSDHGGPFPRHKRAIYETGTKVPFFVKLPKGKKEKIDTNEFLSFIDFAPTVLSIAGIEVPSFLQGKAFLGKYKDESKREYLFTASDRFDENPDRIRAVRDDKFKYIRNYFPENSHALNVAYRRQMVLMRHLTSLHLQGKLSKEHDLWFRVPKLREELYDLENDPFELNNLSEKPEYSNQLNILSKVLDDWIKEIDDLGRIPENELYKMISGD
jgi:N-sulfoglucosamine sulfohydrolase